MKRLLYLVLVCVASVTAMWARANESAMPVKVVVVAMFELGRGAERRVVDHDGILQMRDRAGGESRESPLAEHPPQDGLRHGDAGAAGVPRQRPHA